MSEETQRQLEALAAEFGETQSAVVRRLIAERHGVLASCRMEWLNSDSPVWLIQAEVNKRFNVSIDNARARQIKEALANGDLRWGPDGIISTDGQIHISQGEG